MSYATKNLNKHELSWSAKKNERVWVGEQKIDQIRVNQQRVKVWERALRPPEDCYTM